jgi:4-amino-4-deoxy-L-arabinose transferase-like glycosyltransferase
LGNGIAPATDRPHRWWLVLGVLAVAAVWFGTLDMRHLLRSDEGRYAEIAREMWVSGDWITPRYNGLKYFEKPPLHLWMTALAYQWFGLGEWQARWWVAASGAFGLGMTMLATQRWYGRRVAWLAGLVLLAAPNWNLASHFNSLDMSLSGLLAVVLAATLLAQHPETDARGCRRWMALAWAAIALAVLTKGLIGLVLPGLSLLVYTAWTRELQVWRRLHIVGGALLALAITTPWFWVVAQRNPEFLHFFFVHEHFERYTSTVHQRSAPFWYFVPQLLWGFLPWTGLWPRIAGLARQAPAAAGFRPVAWLASWALTVFVFFSLSGSKLPGYIVPMMPALAVLAALALDRLPARTWTWLLWAALLLSGLLLAASPLAARLSSGNIPNALFKAYAPWLAVAALVLVAGSALALVLQRRGRPDASVVAYALAMFCGTTVALLGHETLGRGISGIDLVPAIRRLLTPEMPLYGVKQLDHTLPFYLGHTLVMVAEPDELAFGTQQEPQKWLPTLAAFGERWQHGPRALALMSPATYAELSAQGLPMQVVAQDMRRVVVANFPLPK